MLDIRDVRVIYPNGLEVLGGASLTASPGEVVAILGRSGSGKSTLLRCINGLQRVQSGSIRLDSVEITQLRPEQIAAVRARIGFIWQEHHLAERLSAFTNVLTGRLGHRRDLRSLFGFFSRDDRSLAFRCLERVNLLHRAHYRADRLSGGERQRVGIARALAQQPRILLADEPVSNLDRELAWQVMTDLVRAAREERVPTVVCLHDVALARAFVDRIVGLVRGVTVFDGVPAAVTDAVLEGIYQPEATGVTNSAGVR